jgi:hypothetical protein
VHATLPSHSVIRVKRSKMSRRFALDTEALILIGALTRS